jgi:predicted ATPase
MNPPKHARIVCLVGENGSGKSSVLEVLNAAAFKLGLLGGGVRARNPYGEPHEFSVTLDLSDDIEPMQIASLLRESSGSGTYPERMPSLTVDDALATWDGTLTVHSERGDAHESGGTRLLAGSISDPDSSLAFAESVSAVLNRTASALCLHLDALRIAPVNSITGGVQRAPNAESSDRGAAFETLVEARTRWIDEFLRRDQEAAERHWALEHEAAELGITPPPFENPNAFFGGAVTELLPHIRFLRADLSLGDLLFEVNGQRVPLAALSSSEQEIVFLVGQLEGLQLERGLLLLDEPELRLNPALLGSWLDFLGRRVGGQVWLGTHSFEAVKAAGPEATILFTRSEAGPYSSKSLADAPILATISAAMGWPAYSLTRRFVFVEGELNSQNDDLARFHRLFPTSGIDAISICVEQGSGGVIDAYRDLAKLIKDATPEERQQLRVGAVVDRDHRDLDQINEILNLGIHVLGCHELENLFLHPRSIAAITEGEDEETILEFIRQAADRQAGNWIVNRAQQRGGGSLQRAGGAHLRKFAQLTWTDIAGDPDGVVIKIAEESGPLDDSARDALRIAVRDFSELSVSENLWCECEGKEVEKAVALGLGYDHYQKLERLVSTLWRDEPTMAPESLASLRNYVDSLGSPAITR